MSAAHQPALLRDIGVIGLGLWEAEPIGNEIFDGSGREQAEVKDPYHGCRSADGIVRVAGAELIPGTHDRTLAAVERSFGDPFRGARRRRWFPDDLPVSDAETDAARRALADAGLEPGDVDALLVHSFLPDQLNPKNSPLVADKLGIRRAFTLEVDSVCNSALSQLRVGASLIAAGQARHVLCVQSIAYSRVRDPKVSTTVIEADMASAFVLGPVPGAAMTSAWRTAGELHGAIRLEWRRPTGAPPPSYWQPTADRLLISFDRELQRQVNADVATYAKSTCKTVLEQIGWEIADVELFVSHQPMSWFTPYMEDTLGLADGVGFSTFEEYANINSASVTASLHAAKQAGRLVPGTRVLLYCPAAGYTYAAMALQW